MTHFVFNQSDERTLRQYLKSYHGDELRARLSIYRNNTYHSLIEALKDLYPSVVNTIGENLFTASARDFLSNHPPHSAAMVDFGHEFPLFIRTFGPLASLTYLGDLAAVDLARHLSYHAAEQSPLPAEAFSQLDIAAVAQAKIKPLDSVHLISSPFAIFDIWQLAQAQSEKKVDADRAQHILILRPDADVDIYQLGAGTFTFFQQLLDNHTLSEALEAALEADHHFDSTGVISFLIQSGFTAQIIGEAS